MTSNGKQTVVLLVEDDALLANIMRRRLEQLHCDVRLATTCQEAMDSWGGLQGHLVLMDYRLPDGKGTEVVQRMREQHRTDPVYFMTAESESIPTELRQALNVKDVLGKPVSVETLRQVVERQETAAPVAAAPAHQAATRHLGRFRVITLRGIVTGARVARCYRAAQSERWMAVQISAPEQLASAAWRGLCAWAGWLSSQGGRLCLIAANADQLTYVQSQTNNAIDVVDSQDALMAHGWRLTGAAERSGLLATIINEREG